MTKRSNATREKFWGWLSSKGSDDLVGISQDDHRCPLATFLAERDGKRHSANEIEIDHSPTPVWAIIFIRHVDMRVSTITAGQALCLLERVP